MKLVPKLPRFALYLTSFALGRGALFLAPLLLASILPADAYGQIEWAQAAAALAALIVALGAGSVVPLSIHGRASGVGEAIIRRHFLTMVGLWLLIALPIASIFLASGWRMAAYFTPVIVLQSFLSIRLKSVGRVELSLLLNAGLFLALTLGALLGVWLGSSDATTIAIAAVAAYGVGLFICISRPALQEDCQEFGASYLRLLRLSIPLMGASIASMLATTSGRLGIGLISGFEATAIYAVLYRGTAIPVIGHQLLLTALFRRAYVVETEKLDKTIFVVPVIVTLLALLFWLATPWGAPLLGQAFERTIHAHVGVASILLAQTVLWSGISLNDLAIAREHVVRGTLGWSLLSLLALSIAAIVHLNNVGGDVETYAIAHFVVISGFYLTQVVSMCRCRVYLPRVWFACGVGTAFLLAVFLGG